MQTSSIMASISSFWNPFNSIVSFLISRRFIHQKVLFCHIQVHSLNDGNFFHELFSNHPHKGKLATLRQAFCCWQENHEIAWTLTRALFWHEGFQIYFQWSSCGSYMAAWKHVWWFNMFQDEYSFGIQQSKDSTNC